MFVCLFSVLHFFQKIMIRRNIIKIHRHVGSRGLITSVSSMAEGLSEEDESLHDLARKFALSEMAPKMRGKSITLFHFFIQ